MMKINKAANGYVAVVGKETIIVQNIQELLLLVASVNEYGDAELFKEMQKSWVCDYINNPVMVSIVFTKKQGTE